MNCEWFQQYRCYGHWQYLCMFDIHPYSFVNSVWGSKMGLHFFIISFSSVWIIWLLYLQLSSSIAWQCSLCLTLSLKSTTAVLLTQTELEQTSKLLFILNGLCWTKTVSVTFQQAVKSLFFLKILSSLQNVIFKKIKLIWLSWVSVLCQH